MSRSASLDRRHANSSEQGHHVNRRRAGRIAKHVAHDIFAMSGEFIGTFLFLWAAFMGAQSALHDNLDGPNGVGAYAPKDNQTILFMALSFGMSLIAVAWACFRITGSAFNPAVTFALWLVGNMGWRRAIMTSAAQLVGGIAAAAVTKGLVSSDFHIENSLAAGMLPRNGMAIEMFTTALLVFVVLMLAAEKSKSTFLAPVAIGLALFVGNLASIGWTGAGINPARTFGPQVVGGFWPGYSWLYYVGQYLGALVATAAYILLKSLDYEGVVGGNSIESENPEDSIDVATAPMMQAIATARQKVPIVGTTSGSRQTDAIATERDLEEGRLPTTSRTTSSVGHRGSQDTVVSTQLSGKQQQHPKWIAKT